MKYADDYAIYKSCRREDIELTINEVMCDVRTMNKYFESCGLTLNFSKTKFMVIRNND